MYKNDDIRMYILRVSFTSVIRAISYAKKITYPLLTSFTKAIRKNTRLTVNLGMKMNKQSMALLGKASFSLTLIEL